MPSPLEQQVNQLAALRRELQALESRERKLAASIRAQMREHGCEALRTGSVEARLIATERLSISPRKLHVLLDEREFLSCVAVKISEARRHVGERALRRIAKIQRSYQLRLTVHGAAPVSSRPPAGSHETASAAVA
jgi:hypothetical protein